jgi:methyl-CpG-binding domain protein 4
MIKTMVDDLMVQQQIRGPHKKWKHMVAVMCLNLTYRKHVKIILPRLFMRYPNPEAYLRGRLATQQRMLKPLGMWEVRSKRIRKMTEQYMEWDGKEASDLHGIGKYGSDSYRIFFFNQIPPDVQDKELKKYVDKLIG